MKNIVMGVLFCAAAAWAKPVFADAAAPKNVAILITGLSGSRQFQSYFRDSVEKLVPILEASGYSGIYRFSEKPEVSQDADLVTRENLQNRLKSIAEQGPYENVFVWIAGHANGRDEESFLHLPEQDVSYKELMGWLEAIDSKRSLFALAIPQGQSWIKALAKPGRAVVAGSGLREYDFIPWMFLRNFPGAFQNTARFSAGESGPLVTSLKDVFVEAQNKSQAWYRDNHLQPTELAYLDADGDGLGEALFDPAALPEPEEPTLQVPEAPPVPAERGKLKAKAVDFSSIELRADHAENKKYEIKVPEPADGMVLADKNTAAPPAPSKAYDFEMLPDSKEAQKILFTISRGGERHDP